MSYQQIETLVREVAGSLQEPIKLGIGREQELNKFSSEDVLLWMIVPTFTSEAIGESNKLINTYSIELFFFFSDLVSNNDSKRTNELLYIAERYSQDFIISFLDKFNDIEEEYNTANITGISTSPVYKFSSKVLSGVLTTFSLSLPDDFVYCLPVDC